MPLNDKIIAIFKYTFDKEFILESPEYLAPYLDDNFIINGKSLRSELLKALQEAIRKMIGYKCCINGYESYVYKQEGEKISTNCDYTRISLLFENICRNINLENGRFIPEQIYDYLNEIDHTLETHPNVNLLLTVLRRIYSNDYDGKPGNYGSNKTEDNEKQFIDFYGNQILFGIMKRHNLYNLPLIVIKDVDKLEKSISNYIDSIMESSSSYNIFVQDGFTDAYNQDALKMMILEGTILNIPAVDTGDLCKHFDRYSKYVQLYGLQELRMPPYNNHLVMENINIGLKETNEEDATYRLHAFLKPTDLEYETPYFLSLFVNDESHVIELPNVRFGVCEEEGSSIAYIYATQSSPRNTNPNFSPVSLMQDQDRIIKENIPKTSKYRYYNPNHLISIIITMGILKGIGINRIRVLKEMPIRCYKTKKDKGYNTEEHEKYLRRVNDKYIETFYKVSVLMGHEATGHGLRNCHYLTIDLNEDIVFEDEYLNNIFTKAYQYGRGISGYRISEDTSSSGETHR